MNVYGRECLSVLLIHSGGPGRNMFLCIQPIDKKQGQRSQHEFIANGSHGFLFSLRFSGFIV